MMLLRIIKKNLWRFKRQPFNNDAGLVAQLTAEMEILRQELRYMRRELVCSEAALADLMAHGNADSLKPRKICFVALYPYSLFNPETDFIFGGSEVRAWLFSTGLAEKPSNEVSFIVFDHGQKPIETHQKVKVFAHSYYKTFMPIPALPPVEADWQAIKIENEAIPEERLAIYKRVNADVYVVPGVNDLSAEVTAFCKRENKKMVLMLGSDIDLSDVFHRGSRQLTNYGARGAWGYYALTNADLIVAQTAKQKALLKKKFGRDSVVIKNPVDLSNFFETTKQDVHAPMVLWVGKSDIVKRPDVCLALAAQYPQYSFEMIMNRSNDAIFEQIVRDATSNVKIIEYTPFNEIEEYFARAKVLVNTSVFEGFPNVFLQAAKYGVPILSLQVDPNDFIRHQQCGIIADGDMDILSSGLKQLIENGEFYNSCSGNVLRYVKENHDLSSRVGELDAAIVGLFE